MFLALQSLVFSFPVSVKGVKKSILTAVEGPVTVEVTATVPVAVLEARLQTTLCG